MFVLVSKAEKVEGIIINISYERGPQVRIDMNNHVQTLNHFKSKTFYFCLHAERPHQAWHIFWTLLLSIDLPFYLLPSSAKPKLEALATGLPEVGFIFVVY